MRDLEMKDVYKMSKILKKMGLKEDFTIDSTKSVEQVGVEFVITVFEHLHMAENEVNAVMGDLIGMTAEEFEKLPFEEGMKHIEEFKSKPGIMGFFKSAGRLMK